MRSALLHTTRLVSLLPFVARSVLSKCLACICAVYQTSLIQRVHQVALSLHSFKSVELTQGKLRLATRMRLPPQRSFSWFTQWVYWRAPISAPISAQTNQVQWYGCIYIQDTDEYTHRICDAHGTVATVIVKVCLCE